MKTSGASGERSRGGFLSKVPQGPIKLLIPVVAALVLFCSGLALAAGEVPTEGSSPTTSSLSSPPPDEPGGPELAGKRTADSQTFLLADGGRETRIYAAPINYRDAEGDLMPIEEGLQPAEGSGLTNGNSGFEVHLPTKLGAAPVRLAVGDQWIAARLLGEPTEAAQLEHGGESVTYESGGSGSNFELSTLANGLKEEIEIRDAAQTSVFHFELTASNGLTPSEAPDGSVQFKDQSERVVGALPAPNITDSSAGARPSHAVHYKLESIADGRWQLTVEVDRDWLTQPDRAWPVRIDPTLELKTPALDCAFIGAPGQAVWTECGSGGAKEMGAQYFPTPTSDGWQRSALRFDLSSIPKSAYVASATVGLHAAAAAANTSGVEVRSINPNDPWTGWGSTTGVSWLTYDQLDKWRELNGEGKFVTVEGGAYVPNTGAEVLTSIRGSQAGWWNFSGDQMTLSARNWVANPSGNTGLLVKLKDDKVRECGEKTCTQRKFKFDSSAASDPNNRPYMTVTWYAAAPSTSKIVSPREGARTAHGLKLKSAWTSEGVTGVTYQYKSTSTNVWQTIPTNLIKNAKGQSVSWPMPVQGKETEPVYFDASHAEYVGILQGQLYVRALFEGPIGVAGYSAPVNAEVSLDLGSAHDATTQVGPGSLDLDTGNFTVGATDVAIPTPNSTLEFGRADSSRAWGGPETSVLGWGWTPNVAVEAAGGTSWRNAREVNVEEGSYTVITGAEGGELPFEHVGEKYVAPPEAAGWELLSLDSTHLALSDPDGNRTIFEKNATGTEYLPTSVSQPGGAGNQTQFVYKLVGGTRRLETIIAPASAGVTCNAANFKTELGCRSLAFTYQAATTWGAPAADGERLARITYFGPASGTTMGQWDVAQYAYDVNGQMTQEWDPRISPNLKTNYAYTQKWGLLKTLTPPGEEPWTMEYAPATETVNGFQSPTRNRNSLLSVSRPSLVSSPSVAKTTIAYEVPISGGAAPSDLSAASVEKWGQQDLPNTATAVFPPNEVPPTGYAHAKVYYMDAEGQLVNTATPSGAGTSEPSISTSEPDEFGNVVRELTAQNRLRALTEEPKVACPKEAKSACRSHELETKRNYSADGTQLEQEWGPTHQVHLESGLIRQARLHRTVQYEDPAPPAGMPQAHLPTRETTGASIVGEGSDAEQRVTETKYNWTLRKPIERIVDPLGLELKTRVEYDPTSGLPTERSLPGKPTGGDAHTIKTIYYSAQAQSPDPACQSKPAWANLPCKLIPASQPGTAGQPELLVSRYASYSPLGQPTEVLESPGGSSENVRKTIAVYDAAGRELTRKIEGGGTEVSKTETVYSSPMGLPTTQRLVCEKECELFDNQAVTTTYDALGRPIEYLDADGSKSTIKYDLLGRMTTTSDGKGTQTRIYDPTSGLLTELQDSAAGTFTATYDADGNLTERGFPDGLTAKTAFNEADEPVQLSYLKSGNCGVSCTWLEEADERSVYGKVIAKTGTLASDTYSYDKAGRLTLAEETPQGGPCVTRSYGFDKDSNRTSLVTRPPVVGNTCNVNSGGTSQSYTYDASDRLYGSGLIYDNFGRITSLPAVDTGGKVLSTGYFSNDMVALQTQNGITNTYQLDGGGRQRQRLQGGGGLEGSEVFHYSDQSDSPSWTVRGASWSRNIKGIVGELVAIQDSSAGTSLQLSNLHGDIIATASTSPTVTKLTNTFQFDEYGDPVQGSAGRYGWLGSKLRRTELPSGVIQMGARSYVPQIGRFLTPDPVRGGSANAYDYADGDPVNEQDLAGTCSGKHCRAHSGLGNARAVAGGGAATRSSIFPSTVFEFSSVAPAAFHVTKKVLTAFKEMAVKEAETAAERAHDAFVVAKSVDLWIYHAFYPHADREQILTRCLNGAIDTWVQGGDPEDILALGVGCVEGMAEE